MVSAMTTRIGTSVKGCTIRLSCLKFLSVSFPDVLKFDFFFFRYNYF